MFRLISRLPFPVLRVLAAFAAFWVRVSRWRLPLVVSHLDRCLGARTAAERVAIADGFYRYLGELVAEVLHAPRISRDELEARVRLENTADLRALLDDGQRVMILAAHHCNWEWLLLECSIAVGPPLTAGYKPASLASADRALKDMRSRFGAHLVPAKQLVQHLIEQRGTVRLLALIADQSPAASNDQQTWLPFFGQDTAFFLGPGWIANKLGYTVWFAAMRRERRGHYAVRFVRLDTPGQRPEVDEVLRAYVRELETHLRAHPLEYFWAYNRWKREKRLYDN